MFFKWLGCWLGFHKMIPNVDSDKYKRFGKCERCGCKSGLPVYNNPPPIPNQT